MNRDLFLAILAMDSYNRGYSERINITGSSSQLGNATIGLESDIEDNSEGVLADFYAIAYEWNGETIISYRGTDNLLVDAATGYGVGAGIAGVPQGDLAIDFYSAVTGSTIFDLNTPENVVLTGHSLGGGLAGLVSTLTGVEAMGFDYMPFAAAAFAKALDSLLQDENDPGFQKLVSIARDNLSVSAFNHFMGVLEELRRLEEATPENFAAANMLFPTLSGFRGEYVADELLTLVRSGDAQAVAASLGVFMGPAGLAWIDYWAQLAIETASYEGEINPREISVFGAEFPDPALIARHSQALLVILKYAEVADVSSDWQAAAAYVLPALYDDSIGQALGREVTDDDNPGGDGLYALNDQLKAAIAYSAIDEGERPFGDQAIKALFDDAVQLGQVLAQEGVSESFRNIDVTP